MSLWPCRTLVATLCPDQVSVVQERWTLTRHGFGFAVEWEHVVGVDPQVDAPAWRDPLEALASALPARSGDVGAVSVVLSNRFLCYALVPPRAELADGREQLAYARHRFALVHGPAADGWDVRLSRHSYRAPAVASAVDRQLLAGLGDLCQRCGMKVASIQPRLMTAANGLWRRLPSGEAWLAFAEPGHLCLALLRGGEWQRLRTMRHDAPWREQLSVMLDRECYQAAGATVPDEVYVWHARERLEDLPQDGRWRFHPLVSRCGADPLPPGSPLQ